MSATRDLSEAEFELMAMGLACAACRSRAKKEVYRCVGPRTFLVRCLNCEHAWRVTQVFAVSAERAEEKS